jgi:hypothetical protein
LSIGVEYKTVERRLDRMDRIYCSAECRAAFLFRFDVDDHKEMSGHDRMHELSFSYRAPATLTIVSTSSSTSSWSRPTFWPANFALLPHTSP